MSFAGRPSRHKEKIGRGKFNKGAIATKTKSLFPEGAGDTKRASATLSYILSGGETRRSSLSRRSEAENSQGCIVRRKMKKKSMLIRNFLFQCDLYFDWDLRHEERERVKG